MTHTNPIKAERPPEQLATVLLLLQRARRADSIDEVGFLLVNETNLLVSYRQAFFWRQRAERKGKVWAVANLPMPNQDAALTIWLSSLCSHLFEKIDKQPFLIDRGNVPESLAAGWKDFLPSYALWAPIPGNGGLLLAADKPWSKAECHLLSHWTEGAGQSMDSIRLRQVTRSFGRTTFMLRRKPLVIAAVIFAVCLLMLPLRLTVLAPAEVVPSTPVVVRAPLAGVIEDVMVTPDSVVARGDQLFRLDNRELVSRLEITRRGLEMAQSEYRHAAQSAITSKEAQVRKALLSSRIEQQRAEYNYVNELLQRIDVSAPINGIAIFPDASSLQGRPVRLGEKVLTLADSTQVMLEAWIPPADSIELKTNSPVDFFLNIRPDKPLTGTVQQIAHQASMSPDGFFGYRAVIHFDPDVELPRIGLRGIAKLHGSRANLGYLIVRRPLTALRQLMGW
jgi:hypothetical protein